ncbi:hypothetical protein GJ744_009716 [Endocarpon pusillum]|uniref:Aminotransferase class I/classII large domain-containing protein n=1 Tax=Endocarpon pusillum TaxID=364733 RepID=A0A8H7E9B7_9EURO|nr:hypothetical protein GJ744_009716 [Endocarpon pusillum]
MAASMLAEWIKSQQLRGPAAKGATTFHRNLEEALDVRRRGHGLYALKKSLWRNGAAVDFNSSDALSLGASGRLRAEFNKELERYPDLPPGPTSSRIMDGNYEYLEMVEEEIARFHEAETALFLGSGYDANVAVFCAIPRPGDAILYDELIHASAHDGIQQSQVACRIPFHHNDVEAFRDALESIVHSQPLIRQGKRCVIVAVESVYSMDGDICPLQDLIDAVKEIMPVGSTQFYVDEAHATGVLGPRGGGLVHELGVEKEVAIRLHTFGKALASTGAVVLGSKTVKSALINFARGIIFTTAPGFPTVAAVRSAYTLMATGQTMQAQETIQVVVRYFFEAIASNPTWQEAENHGILSVPLSYNWKQKPFVSHIVPICTRPQYSYWLVFHLAFRKLSTYPLEYPVIPKGQSRVRLTFHSHNTKEQIDELISAICNWAQEMMEIELGQGEINRIPKAARQVYSLMNSDNMIE